MNGEKITFRQTTAIFTGFFLGTSIVMNPAAESGADAWLAILISLACGLLIAGLTIALALLHPGKSLVEILTVCFGKVAGRLLGFLYFLFTFWLSSGVITTFSYYSVTTSYPETPVVFVSVCYMLVIAFAVKIGLEVIGRISEVLLIFIVLVTAVTLFTLLENFHLDAFLPMFKDGIAKPVLSGVKSSPLPFAEILLALNILPNLNNRKKTPRSVWTAVLIAGGLFFISTVRNILVLGVDVTQRNIYPSEKVFRLMPGIDILPLLDTNVIIGGIIKVSVSLYAQAKILGDILGLKEFKLLVLPLAVLDEMGSILFTKDIFTQIAIANKMVPLAYIPGMLVLPFIMVLVSLFRKSPRAAALPGQKQTQRTVS